MQLTLERKKQLAMLTLVIGALVWVPTLLKVPSPLWLLTFPLGLIGAYFAYKARATSFIVLNVLLFFSYFVLLALFMFMRSY